MNICTKLHRNSVKVLLSKTKSVMMALESLDQQSQQSSKATVQDMVTAGRTWDANTCEMLLLCNVVFFVMKEKKKEKKKRG